MKVNSERAQYESKEISVVGSPNAAMPISSMRYEVATACYHRRSAAVNNNDSWQSISSSMRNKRANFSRFTERQAK